MGRASAPACLPSRGVAIMGRHGGLPHRCLGQYILTRSQVARGNEATKRLSLIVVFIERNNAGGVRPGFGAGVHRVARIEAVGGALLVILIPEIAALPDAIAQAGERADGGGVVSHHILRTMAGSARPTLSAQARRLCYWCARDPCG